MKKSAKVLLFVAGLVFLSGPAWSQEAEPNEKKSVEQKVWACEDFFVPETSIGEWIETQIFYSVKMDPLYARVGCSFGNVKSNAMAEFQYFPLNFIVPNANLHLGFNQIFHWRRLYDVSDAFDIMPGACFIVETDYGFDFKFKIYYLLKISKIMKMEKGEYLRDHEFAFDFSMEKNIGEKVQVGLGLSSFDDFYYPKMFAPIFNLGVNVDISERVFFGGAANVRYIDFFTLSGHIESFELKVFGGIRF